MSDNSYGAESIIILPFSRAVSPKPSPSSHLLHSALWIFHTSLVMTFRAHSLISNTLESPFMDDYT